MKLGLGGAQFGLPYGYTNDRGQISAEEVGKILKKASAEGIDLIDTAAVYGNSEAVLGSLKESQSFKIVTKIPALNGVEKKIADLKSDFKDSLVRLKQKSIYGLLLHRADDLLENHGEQVFADLLQLKAEGFVQKIGVSIYGHKQIESILEKYAIDLVQLPLNIFDQRLIQSGALRELKKRNIEVHGRSIFLQGLLATPPERLPKNVEPARLHIQRFHEEASKNGVSARSIALDFARRSGVDYGLVGIAALDQLTEVIADFKTQPQMSTYEEWAWTGPESVINPSAWGE